MVEEGLEEEAGLAVVEEISGCDVLDGLGTVDWPDLCSGDGFSTFGGFSRLEMILWRKILRGSYSGSGYLCCEEGGMRSACMKILIRLLVYTFDPEEPTMWMPS